MGVQPLRVFVSHTSELAAFPEKRSYVEAACAAVRRAGGVAVDMADFGAAYLHADRPATAVGHLDTAVAETGTGFVRDQAFWLGRSATAQVRCDRIDEGRETAERALDILAADLDSDRVAGAFTDFCAALGAKDPASARDFADRLAASR